MVVTPVVGGGEEGVGKNVRGNKTQTLDEDPALDGRKARREVRIWGLPTKGKRGNGRMRRTVTPQSAGGRHGNGDVSSLFFLGGR